MIGAKWTSFDQLEIIDVNFMIYICALFFVSVSLPFTSTFARLSDEIGENDVGRVP